MSEKRREKTLAREIQDKLNVAYSTALAAVRFHDLNGSLDHWLDEARALPELSEEERTWTVRCVRCFEPFDDGHAKVCKGP